MTELGYFLSSEEHAPNTLVDNARLAEEAGFCFALLSDHFHPWTREQGNAPFAWSVLGAIASRTTTLKFGTAVTCPILRIHPTIVAHAAATVAAMAPGRFWLGLGTGEYLNEHVTGKRWPSASERLDLLSEAIEIIRALWTGDLVSREGAFRVDRARLLTLPERPPEIFVAATGTNAAQLAAQQDGLICSGPNQSAVSAFEEAGGGDRPRIAMLRVCFDKEGQEAREFVMQRWPNGAYSGSMHTDLPLPEDFEEAAKLARPEHFEDVVSGRDPEPYVEEIRKATDMGFTHLVLHHIGDDQAGFIRFIADEVAPRVRTGSHGGVALDRMVEETFPASDPISSWAGSDNAKA